MILKLSMPHCIRKNEVEFLLRRPINSDADIQFAFASAEAGLIFMDEVSYHITSLHIDYMSSLILLPDH